MSKEILLGHLIGRTVHDVDGRKIGRIEELFATIQLHAHGNDYVVTEFHVGAFGWLEAVAGGQFGQHFVKRVANIPAYRMFRIPWSWIDLTDPAHPRMKRPKSELEKLTPPA